MDGYYRNGELIDHKAKADEAAATARGLGIEVDKLLVWRRHPGRYTSASAMLSGGEFFVDELLGDYRGRIGEPVSMPAEAPLFRMYARDTTVRPKGCQHSTGGYLADGVGTSRYDQDIRAGTSRWWEGARRSSSTPGGRRRGGLLGQHPPRSAANEAGRLRPRGCSASTRSSTTRTARWCRRGADEPAAEQEAGPGRGPPAALGRREGRDQRVRASRGEGAAPRPTSGSGCG